MIRSNGSRAVQRQRLFAAGGGAHLVAFLLQVELERTGEIQFVFHQENSATFGVHVSSDSSRSQDLFSA